MPRGRSRALVTGAASGLGRACVELLRARGCTVAGLDLPGADVDADVVTACDVSDAAAVQAAVSAAVNRLGGLDAVAHCAGAFPDRAVPLHALPPATWERTIAVNLTGSYAVARAALPALLAGGGGAVVLAASVSGGQPTPGAAVYAASKAGVTALARAVALEYAHRGIRANTVSPGWMDTPMAAPVLGRPDLREPIERAVPLGRVARPEEVAACIAWLLSDEARYVTGQDLVVDGGGAVAAYAGGGDLATIWRRVKD